VSAPTNAPGPLYPETHSSVTDYSMDDSSFVPVNKLPTKNQKNHSADQEYTEQEGSHSSLSMVKVSALRKESESDYFTYSFLPNNIVEIKSIFHTLGEQDVQIRKSEPKTDIIPCAGRKCLEIKISLRQGINANPIEVLALIDSGCTISIMDKQWAAEQSFQTTPLEKPMRARLADGSWGASEALNSVKATMSIGENHVEEMNFPCFNVGSHKVFLGYDWLKKNQPQINWADRWISFPRRDNLSVATIAVSIVEDSFLAQMQREFPTVFSDAIFRKGAVS